MSSTYILTVFFLVIVLLIFMVSKLKLNAAMSLLLVTIVLAIAIGTPLGEIPSLINAGFGSTAASVALVIFLGSLLGEILGKTGAATKITDSFISVFGEKRVLWALAISCLIMGVPIFPDTISLLIVPIASLLAVRTGISMIQFAAVMQIGITSSSLVPPTPGPVAAAAILGLSLGQVIPWGALVCIPGLIATVLYAKTLKDDVRPKEQYIVESETKELPSFLNSMLPILLPILLIVLDNVVSTVAPDTTFSQVSSFVGDPLSALLIGCFTALFLQVKGWWKIDEYKNGIVNRALESCVIPVFITCLGGALGSFIKSSGVADIIAEMIVNASIPAIFVPMVISILIRIITGSNTLALTTTAALVQPMLAGLGLSPLAAFLAMGSGGVIFSHANSSGLWLTSTLTNLSFDQALKSIGGSTAVSGLACCIFTLVLFFVGVI